MSSSPPEESPPSPPPSPPLEESFTSPPSPSTSPPPPSSESSPPSPPPPSESSPPSPPPPSESSPPSPSPPSESSPPSPSPPSSSNATSPSPPPPPSPQNSPPPPSSSSDSDKKNPPYPPPPKSPKSYPPPRGSLTPSKDEPSDPDQSSIIVGAAAAAGLLIFLMIALLVSCSKRKKRKPHNHMNYYRDHSRNDYYASNGNWSTNDHPMKMPPPMGSGQVSSEQNWPIGPPPPPPPMMSSSELGSANYSGPHQGGPRPPPHPAMALGFNQSSFTYTDLAAATNGFAKENLIGQGGFGYVHKGVLPNGRKVAIKSLKANSGQGEREFQAEVDIISRVHHRHLVSLVGYCIAGQQRMLVYEFVPNGNLEYHLHGPDRPTMDWPTRLKIAIGSAKGFAYLHEDCHPRIIHRDIKTANILLENNFEAKVADFGLAKLSEENHTHVSTRIMGTFGYLAPEYASSGKLTEKSDVYSYGIMILELITGRRPIDISSDDDGLVDWARPILAQVQQGGSYEELVDPKLGNNYDPNEMLRMVACAGACIRHSARRRPKMSQILRALEGDASLDDLNEGVKTQNSTLFGSGSSSEYGSYADLSKMRKAAGISSQEFSSGEQGTGEFATEGAPGYNMRGNRGYNL